ncbi:NUDIX domain-containing protein [Hansschlegelia sp. KR7-227]|uniref:NUDIX domain-containing protein n=1 Tax=Hansschlegelia sp. KR7-227 TaxID=3400914 RepID=UPI003BFB37AE
MASRSVRMRRALIARAVRALRGMTLGARALAIDEADRVMLVRHGYEPGWHFPGGSVEIGELAEAAAARELLEETGVVAESQPRLLGLFFNPAFGGRDHVALFRIERFSLGPKPASSREIVESGWFARDDLPDGATPATRRRLAELFDGAEPTGWW